MDIVLRQAILYSLVYGGFKPKYFDQFRRDVTQVYGFKHLLTLQNLQKAGLLVKSDGTKSTHSAVSTAFKLHNAYESNIQNQDLSYVYAGYAPVSVRLVQMAIGNFGTDTISEQVSWKGFEDKLKLIPGEAFEEDLIPKNTSGFRARMIFNAGASRKNASLVVFIGGCTLAEISAIRALSHTSGKHIDILTTQVLSAGKIINDLTEI
jgi:hypothetical protein